MNKILGQLMTMLRAPKTDGDEGGGDPAAGAPIETSLYGKGIPIPGKDNAGADDNADAGAEEDGGGETEDFGDDNAGEGEDLGGEDGAADEGEQKPADEKPQPFLRIAPEDLAAIRGNAGKDGSGDAEPKLTQEQINKLVNPVQVTPELVAAIGHEDPVVRGKALQQFAEATVKNAVSLARLMIQRKEKEFEARLQPIASQHEEIERNRVMGEFYGANKDLVKYELFVKAAVEEVNPKNPDGSLKSRQQIFKEVAAGARKKLADMGLKINQPNANHSAEAKNGVPQANRFSASGRSGGDQHSGKGKPNNADADIYAR